MTEHVIKQMLQRKSVRSFTGERVSDKDLETILQAAQRAPTSINGQQISLIYTRDKAKLAEIAQICGGQAHIAEADVFVAIVIDFNRTALAIQQLGAKQMIEQSAEGIMVGAVDAGIMLSFLQMAAESLGYGTTAIGAVRKHPEKMTALFELPPKTLIAVGTTIGVPSPQAKAEPCKPRVPYESFAMQEIYQPEKVKQGVIAYETCFKDFLSHHQKTDQPSYCEKVTNYYTQIYYNKTAKVMHAQGFEFKDEE